MERLICGPCGAPAHKPKRPGAALAWSIAYLLPALNWHYAHYRDAAPQRVYTPSHKRKDPYADVDDAGAAEAA